MTGDKKMNDLFECKDPLTRIERKLDRLLEILDKPKKKRSVPQGRFKYPARFEQLWREYPKRAGSNSKWKAYQAANKQEFQRLLVEGTKRYARYCDATGKTGTELVMQASRFFGPGKEWENDWELPKPEPAKVPTDVDKLVAFAADLGMEAHPGESPYDFRARVQDAI